ncbi:uncharacterized protein LOC144659847 [Oculina patagonica]
MVHFDAFWNRDHRLLRDRRMLKTSLELPSLSIIVFSTIIFFGFLRAAESRQCDTHRDCLGDYIHCCSGYCRRSCNLTCTRDEHCGSPGSIEEHCCKGKCILASSTCEKPVADEENVLSSPVIAVVVIFGLMLIVAVCCVFRSHFWKLRALCFGERSQQVDMGCKARGAGFVELEQGSVGTEDGLNCTERISMQSTSTWVGQDFRIAPPRSSKRSGV